MLVKVNDAYKGVFGHYIEKYHSVEGKRAGDPPFEVPDHVAHEQIRNGVLTAAEGQAITVEAPAMAEAKAQEMPETVAEGTTDTADFDGMTYRELVAAAKERGISYKNKKADELKEILKEYEGITGAPSLEAEDPI
mgnify:CR=1 FL=1